MGVKLGIFSDSDRRRVGPLVINEADYAMLKKLWSEVETNPQKHGRGIYMRFFAQFPQYLKYFAETGSAASSDDVHRINDKFTLILSTLGYLIIDFYKKPRKFDSILDYVAIIHQDMNLRLEDFSNFSHAITQYLKEALPEIMSDECAQIFGEFVGDLAHQLVAKMAKGRASMSSNGENRSSVYHTCRWFDNREKIIYGHEQSYWKARSKRWESKIQKWETSAGVVATAESSNPTYNLSNNLNNDDDKDYENESTGSSSLSTSPSTTTTEQLVRGSVMSEVLHDRLYSINKEVIFKNSGSLRSRSSQILRKVDRPSTAAAIILAGLEEPTDHRSTRLTARERFRYRNYNSQNEAAVASACDYNRGTHQAMEMNGERDSRITASHRKRASEDQLAKDKTDH